MYEYVYVRVCMCMCVCVHVYVGVCGGSQTFYGDLYMAHMIESCHT